MKYFTLSDVNNNAEIEFWADVGFDKEKNRIVIIKSEGDPKRVLDFIDELSHLRQVDGEGDFMIDKTNQERFFNCIPTRLSHLSRLVCSEIKEI